MTHGWIVHLRTPSPNGRWISPTFQARTMQLGIENRRRRSYLKSRRGRKSIIEEFQFSQFQRIGRCVRWLKIQMVSLRDGNARRLNRRQRWSRSTITAFTTGTRQRVVSQIHFGTQSRVFQIVSAAPSNVLPSNSNCESNEDRHIKCNPRQSRGNGKREHWSSLLGLA